MIVSIIAYFERLLVFNGYVYSVVTKITFKSVRTYWKPDDLHKHI